ncbi:MAG: master DNA invertase Mpi family serine-type recombinase [Treponema sp.]|nr:master DNA invertase Mpi family serine-type recombinase [Candidatus Treponema equifaecale]
MIYGYIRVSTDKQTVENQRFEILNYCQKNNLEINGWIEETISGTQNYRKRKLGRLLSKVRKDDTIISAELSRFGRNLLMVMEILNICINKKCRVWTIKENFKLENDIQSKVLAFAFGLSAEIERNLISQRTKEALARRKSQGMKLGRTSGKRGQLNEICIKNQSKIIKLIEENTSKKEIARRLGISKSTLYRFMTYTGLYTPTKKSTEKWKRGIYQ